VLARDLPPSEVAALAASGVRAEGIPACLAPGARSSAATLDAATLSPSGGLALLPFAEAWVRNGFRTRSLRCDACADQPCGGAHVNAVRAFGFGWMRPRAPGARRGA
jgi:hypothetical protein